MSVLDKRWGNALLVGSRVVLLIWVAILAQTRPPAAEHFATDLLIGALIVAALTATISVRALRPFFPVLVIAGDILSLVLFIPALQPFAFWQIGLASLYLLTAFTVLGVWGDVLELIGIIAAYFIMSGTQNPLEIPGFSVLLAIGVIGWLFGYNTQEQAQQSATRVEAAELAKQEQAEDIRERTRAIYEIAAVMSASMNYKEILFAAMRAGELGLRDLQRKPRMITAVLLYQSKGEMLYVVHSRGFTASDDRLTIPGTQGIIGQAMTTCMPVIGNAGRKDPELMHFVGFQKARSTLCIPLRAGFDNFGALVYGTEEANAFVSDHSELLAAIGTQATIALQNAALYDNLLKERDRLIEAEEEARKKLAADLHDGPTQIIAAISMRVGTITKMLEKRPQDVPNELKRIEDMARQATKDIRTMLFTLRPLILESQGLSAALSQLVDKMRETYNQPVTVSVERQAERNLDQRQQGMVFYIVEEAVNNARKHARASLITVTVANRQDMVIIEISDNGIGFDADSVMTNYEGRGSMGMINLRERAEVLGGSLDINSVLGKGTRITVIVPRKARTGGTAPLNSPNPDTESRLELAAIKRIKSPAQ